MSGPAPVRRSPLHLVPDLTRVLARPFVPGQESSSRGISRADAVVRRVLALGPEVVASTLAETTAAFGSRHRDLPAVFRRHFALVAHRIPGDIEVSDDLAQLVGAYFTQEFTLEGAALCNPSVVADPSQDGVPAGAVRFVMSVRAIGEGHLSTIGFRTGTVGPGDVVTMDPASSQVETGAVSALRMPSAALQRALSMTGDARAAEGVLALLPRTFTAPQLAQALDLDQRDAARRSDDHGLIERIRRLAAGNYQVTFPADVELSARVLHPHSPAESHGMEDARFTPFTDRDGSLTHFATYTAYDGAAISPHLIQTDDFRTFSIRQQTGEAATNKGMALFPRHIADRHWAISRWDRENLSVTSSADALHWERAIPLQRPRHAWDLVQLGTCTSPIETEAGWLVVTHGVGPVRTYSLGAMLLDRDDPATVLAVLDEPLLTVDPPERDGYVPNVVYSCGALRYGDTLALPYGCSDATIRFAFVDLPQLLARLGSRPTPYVAAP